MTVYSCTIPAGTLVKGTNIITLGVTSSRSGSGWLSPNYVSKIKLLFTIILGALDELLTISLLTQIIDFVELYY
jgi:hypothetical protein